MNKSSPWGILTIFCLLCSACSRTQSPTITTNELQQIPDSSEMTELETRKQRWLDAEKCLRAIDAGGNIDELCESNSALKDLTYVIGISRTQKIVNLQQDELEKQELNLNDGVIDEIPEESPMTSRVELEIVKAARESEMQLLDLKSSALNACITGIQAGTRNGTFDDCEVEAEAQYQQYASENNFDEQLEALEKFKQTFKSVP
jgi:hypothetical protein